jgi:hypothetical protein
MQANRHDIDFGNRRTTANDKGLIKLPRLNRVRIQMRQLNPKLNLSIQHPLSLATIQEQAK